jgi:hypothetical protein
VPEDDRLGAPRVLVLTHGLWQRQFGGDSGSSGAISRSRDRATR